MGFERHHYLAWAAGTNPKDFSATALALPGTFGDGFVIPVPEGAFAVTLYTNVVAVNDTTEIELKLQDSPDNAIWSPAQVRTNEVIAAPSVTYDMLDGIYKIIGPTNGTMKSFAWSLTMSEFIKLTAKADGATKATFKGIFVFGVES